MPKINTFSIRLRLAVILGIGVIIVSGFFVGVIKIDNTNEQNLFQSRLDSKQTIFNSTIAIGSNQLQTFADSYTYWDDMVSFVQGAGKNTTFAHENIDSGLITFNTDAAWVYNLQHQLIYSVDDQGPDIGKFNPEATPPLAGADFDNLFKHNGLYHYYIANNTGIFEIEAATIHPSSDSARKTPAQGYFFVGKLLDKSYLSGLGKAVEGNAVVDTSQSDIQSFKTSFNKDSALLTVGAPLKNSRGQTVGLLLGHYTASDLKHAFISQDRINNFGIAIFEFLTIFLVLFMLRWVLFPMNKVQRALKQNSAEPLFKLPRRQDEFGSIARLVAQSFEQQNLLQAQKADVERHVQERTVQLKDEQATLKTLIDSLPVGVFVGRAPGGQPIMINEIGIQILGRDLSPSIDKTNYSEFYKLAKEDGSPYPSDELPLSITLATRKGAMKNNVMIARDDGTKTYLRIMSAPIIHSDGSMPSAVAIFEDITKERELERSRDEFFSIASHELRTPLTTIRGNSSMIQQYYPEILKDQTLNEMVGDIHESSVRLIDIVNDFLDTSRLEQRKVKYVPEYLDLVSLSESVVREYSVTGSRQNINMEVIKPSQPMPHVWADKNRVKQVLINLIGNALKFTEKGQITIHLNDEGDSVKVHVTDTGRGMDKYAQEKLFRKFEQTGEQILTRDSVRGTGLGLYISRMIIEQMGGHIKLESSQEGVGTTFSFSLPKTEIKYQAKDQTNEHRLQ